MSLISSSQRASATGLVTAEFGLSTFFFTTLSNTLPVLRSTTSTFLLILGLGTCFRGPSRSVACTSPPFILFLTTRYMTRRKNLMPVFHDWYHISETCLLICEVPSSFQARKSSVSQEKVDKRPWLLMKKHWV